VESKEDANQTIQNNKSLSIANKKWLTSLPGIPIKRSDVSSILQVGFPYGTIGMWDNEVADHAPEKDNGRMK
jgi:hypothetical protein